MEAITIGALTIGFAVLAFVHNRARRPSQGGETTFWQWVTLEFERARRHETPLALVRVRTIDVRQAATVALELRELGLRPTDRVCTEGPDLYILAPETDRESAATMVTRIVPSGPDIRWVRIAVFPDDAITERFLVDLINSPREGRVLMPFGPAHQAS